MSRCIEINLRVIIHKQFPARLHSVCISRPILKAGRIRSTRSMIAKNYYMGPLDSLSTENNCLVSLGGTFSTEHCCVSSLLFFYSFFFSQRPKVEALSREALSREKYCLCALAKFALLRFQIFANIYPLSGEKFSRLHYGLRKLRRGENLWQKHVLLVLKVERMISVLYFSFVFL